MKKLISSGALVVVIFVAIIVSFGSFYTIDQGERGVLLRYGALKSTVEPGLHFKLPLIDEIVPLSVQSRKIAFENVYSYSRDQQPASIKISINYRMLPGLVGEIYENYGGEQPMVDRLISPKVNQELKTVFGQFNAVTAIQDRARLNTDVLLALQQSIDGPVTVESIQIENIDFSDAYEKSVEDRMLAEVEVQKVNQNWEREKIQAQILVTKATAEADAIRLKGEAEAAAIAARGKALHDNPALVALVQAEKWDGRLPQQMIPNSAVPIISSAPLAK